MLATVPLLTLPQLVILMHWSPLYANWSTMTSYMKFNRICWDLISHLWFLLTLIVLTFAAIVVFRLLNTIKPVKNSGYHLNWYTLWLIYIGCGLIWVILRRVLLIVDPKLLCNALFYNIVFQALFYLPFFVLGALTWKYAAVKTLLVRINPQIVLASAVLFVAYIANQAWNRDGGWMYDLDGLISMQTGLLMTNVVFSLSYRFLNLHSSWINYLVRASLFIYLVHHPLILLYGIFIAPLIHSALPGFLLGLVLVTLGSLLLYEIHLRIPLLRLLFSGKSAKRDPPSLSVKHEAL